MFTLILTAVLYLQGKPAVSVESVPGFTTEASCLKAANAWLQQTRSESGELYPRGTKALCVQVSP